MDFEKDEELMKLINECTSALNLELVSVKTFTDSEMGVVFQILLDHDYNITMDEIQSFTDMFNPKLDKYLESHPFLDGFTLDVSSSGEERVIPFEDISKLIDRYLEVKLKVSGEKILAKVKEFNGEEVTLLYFIKGRKKELVLKEEDISDIHMGYKA